MNIIKTLEKRNLPQLRKFVSEEYNPNHILLNDKFFNWQFKLNPQNFYKDYSMYIADYKNKIIGCNGTIPISLKVIQDEIIGGIFWVWIPIFGINEVPSNNTIIGGFLIFMSIIYYSLVIKNNRRFIGLN